MIVPSIFALGRSGVFIGGSPCVISRNDNPLAAARNFSWLGGQDGFTEVMLA
jgi:hypothetical protein